MDAVTITGVEEIKARLAGLNPVMRRKILKKVSNRIAINSRNRIAAQTDLTGAAWAKRSTRSHKNLEKKKMERGLKKQLKIQFSSDTKAVIGFKAGLTKYIAAVQQSGLTKTFTRTANNPARNLPATAPQAQKMKALGYKVAGKSPSVAWIKLHQTQGSAGTIIRVLEGRQSKQSWQAIIPPRSFLGISANDMAAINQIISDEINNALGNP